MEGQRKWKTMFSALKKEDEESCEEVRMKSHSQQFCQIYLRGNKGLERVFENKKSIGGLVDRWAGLHTHNLTHSQTHTISHTHTHTHSRTHTRWNTFIHSDADKRSHMLVGIHGYAPCIRVSHVHSCCTYAWWYNEHSVKCNGQTRDVNSDLYWQW